MLILRTKTEKLAVALMLVGVLTVAGSGGTRAALPKAPVTVTLAVYSLGDAWNNVLKATIATFEKTHPDIVVKLQFPPIDNYWDKLQTEYAGGAGPDITVNQMNWVVPGAVRGMFVNLTPYIKADKVDMSQYWYSHDLEWKWHGGIYGGLLYAGGQALYVNTDLLKAAGVPFPAANWTWNDLLADAQKLTDPSKNQWGINIAPINPPYWSAAFIHEAGGTVLNKTSTKCTLTSPRSRAGLQFIDDLIAKYKVMPSPSSIKGQQDPFLTGKVAFSFNGTWAEAAVRQAGFHWDFAHMPIDPQTGKRSVQMGSNAWSILSTSKNKEAAWQVVKFLMGPAGQQGMMSLGVPVVKDIVNSKAYVARHLPQHILVVVDDLRTVGHNYYPTPDTDEWWAAVDQELSAIWSGEASVADATTRACAAVDKIFARRPANWNG